MNEYNALASLRTHQGYAVLQALWVASGQELMKRLQTAAGKGQESAWRYYAGQVFGFEVAIGQLERALKEMERDAENTRESMDIDKVITQIRGQKDTSS